MISKIYGCVELDNEVWFEKEIDRQYGYPFLAVQQKKYSNWEKIKFYLNYGKHLNSQFILVKKYICIKNHHLLNDSFIN